MRMSDSDRPDSFDDHVIEIVPRRPDDAAPVGEHHAEPEPFVVPTSGQSSERLKAVIASRQRRVASRLAERRREAARRARYGIPDDAE